MASPIIKSTNLFLVDDDMIFCRTARQQLASLDFNVRCFHDYSSLVAALPHENPDLILLSMFSQDDDGCGICRKIRSVSTVPLIMLSCIECSRQASHCLEAGADDYIIKPCDFQKITARIRAVMRRHHAVPPHHDASTHPDLHYRLGFSGLSIDVMTGMIDGGLSLQQLSDTEAALMQELIGSAPGTVCRERLSRSALRRAWSVGDRTIDVLIGRLRKKLALVTDEVSLITVRGGGYALRPNTAKIAAVHSIGARQPA